MRGLYDLRALQVAFSNRENEDRPSRLLLTAKQELWPIAKGGHKVQCMASASVSTYFISHMQRSHPLHLKFRPNGEECTVVQSEWPENTYTSPILEPTTTVPL
mmetsp:Transcript_30751/g.56874  ORF Transcript_30751/g.56874 Transcript_30751/m.56874 type:complete len:103 (-) Transcript_30751:1212-1520(-)